MAHARVKGWQGQFPCFCPVRTVPLSNAQTTKIAIAADASRGLSASISLSRKSRIVGPKRAREEKCPE